jgi:hypothetical protein
MSTSFLYPIIINTSAFIAFSIIIAVFLLPLSTYRVRRAEYTDRDPMTSENRELLQPWIDRLIELDFQMVSYQIFHDNNIDRPMYEPYYGIIFQHSSQQIFAGLTVITILKNRDPAICGLSSYWQNLKLSTVNIADDNTYSKPPLHKGNYLELAQLDDLWMAHQDFIRSYCPIDRLEKMTFEQWASAIDRESYELVELGVKKNELKWVDRQQQLYRLNRWMVLKSTLIFIFQNITAKKLRK